MTAVIHRPSAIDFVSHYNTINNSIDGCYCQEIQFSEKQIILAWTKLRATLHVIISRRFMMKYNWLCWWASLLLLKVYQSVWHLSLQHKIEVLYSEMLKLSLWLSYYYRRDWRLLWRWSIYSFISMVIIMHTNGHWPPRLGGVVVTTNFEHMLWFNFISTCHEICFKVNARDHSWW